MEFRPAINLNDDSERQANFGHPEFMLRLSSKIVANPSHPNRMIEAYKWGFIAWYMGESGAEAICHYLRKGMSEKDAEEAIKLAEMWLDGAIDAIQGGERDGWSKSMLDLADGYLIHADQVTSVMADLAIKKH